MISRSVLIRMKNFSDTRCRENQKHFIFSKDFAKNELLMRKCGKIWYSQRRHWWHHGSCALHAGYLKLYVYTQARAHARTHTHTHTHTHTRTPTLRICNNYCFSAAKMVVQTTLSVTFIRKLHVFVIIANACLPLLTVPALFIFSFSLIHPLLLVYIALTIPYIILYL
jgi:hypothetical protein